MSDLPQPADIEPADWEQTPLAVRTAFCNLLTQLATLQAQLTDLTARLNQHSGNSSRPPSADPPAAPKRQPRPPRGLRRGAQPGHPGAHRALLPPEQIDEFQLHRPLCCPHCQADLPADLPPSAEVQRRQVIEVPLVAPYVTEHQLLCVSCPHCAQQVRASLPDEVPPGAFGANLVALVALLHGRFRLSEREVAALLGDLFGIEMALGSVAAACQTVSAALEPSYQQVQQTLVEQPVANTDETGWKQAGKRQWLWVAVSRVCTLFMLAGGRNRVALNTLLGEFAGVVGSDRFTAYDALPLARRQLCWAHLKRNITWFAERDGAVKQWADKLLLQVAQLFKIWHQYRVGKIERGQLVQQMMPVQQQLHQLLREGQGLNMPKAVSFSADLLAHWRALWTFIYTEGVEPTNNSAERALRPAVLWRKGCFGTQSDAGNRFVERLLTVRATCEQQQQHLWSFLGAAVTAHWADKPSPILIPNPT